MSDLHRRAIEAEILDTLRDGLTEEQIDARLTAAASLICHSAAASVGAQLYAGAHPDGQGAHPDALICCDQVVLTSRLASCTCWRAEYDDQQAPPDHSTTPTVRDGKCHDCAFRPDSPERADPYVREQLYRLAAVGERFWCHQGMLRPARWRHSRIEGLTVDGSPDNWTPPIVDGVPYLLDGRAGEVCAGWHALHRDAIRARRRVQENGPA